MLNDEQLQAFIQGRLRPDEADRFAAEIEASDELQQRLAKLSVDKNTEDLRHAGRSELEPPVPTGIAQTADYASDRPASSQTIGPYKLLKLVGSGGMGEVWLAEQSSPIKRRVAIKMIKAGMDSKQIVARFEAERQALALMDHPNIAKVYDAGIAENGRPFVVMEYVKGIPLTDYCDQARLPLKERLQLFVPICAAVQHAHQKGIIHRDLKPSNILVCLYDGQPVPKVIDFGLAKAMHQSLTDLSMFTAQGMLLGTPLYMSPEQAEQSNLDIDTRADIYSLGVILYELLVGSTPLERATIKEAAWNEVLRLIKEFEPPRPSTRLSNSEALPSIAAQRRIDPNQLRKSLAGDLDWVVMKALEKERSRRYETANGLAMDIHRYLANEPVSASPPSARYRLQKFVQRNRAGVFAGVALGTSLLLGLVGTSLGMKWAWQERAKAVAAGLLEADAKRTALASAQQARDEASRAERQTAEAIVQRDRAEKREKEAINAIRSFGDSVANNLELKYNPSLESLRKTLLKEPLAFLKSMRERLQSDRVTRPESLQQLAYAAFSLGSLISEWQRLSTISPSC